MTDKTKSISEALAEVQRKVNEQRMKNAESNWNAVKNESLWDDARKWVGDRMGLRKPAANTATSQNTTPASSTSTTTKATSNTPKMSYSDYSQTGVGTVEPTNRPPEPAPGSNGKVPDILAPTVSKTTAVTSSPASTIKPAPAAAPKPAAATPTPSPRPNGAPLPTPAAPAPQKSQIAQNADAAINRIGNTSEFEDGGPSKSKGKKSMKEEMSPLVAAFLKLQESKPANMFEAAKKMKAVCPNCGKSPCVCESMEEEKELSPKQKKIAALGGDKKKLDAADFKALRSGKKPMEEEVEKLFSEEELAHFASVIEGDAPSVAPARDDIANRSDKHDTNSDYGMDEEAKKRGVKAGTKRGPYKQKGLSSGEKDEAQAETKNVPAQVRTARSHFSGGKEVVTLKHPQTDKQYHVPVKHVNDFNKEYAAAEKPHEKSAVERKFMQTHMSN